MLDANYVETSSLITLDVPKGGSCMSQKCTDYGGQQEGGGGGGMANPPATKPKPVVPPVKAKPMDPKPMEPKPMDPKPMSSSSSSTMKTTTSTKAMAMQTGMMMAGDTSKEGNADKPKKTCQRRRSRRSTGQ